MVGTEQMDAVSRYRDRPMPRILVRTGTAASWVTQPSPVPLRPDSIREALGYRRRAPSTRRKSVHPPISSRAPDGDDKLLPPFGDENYPQFKLGREFVRPFVDEGVNGEPKFPKSGVGDGVKVE